MIYYIFVLISALCAYTIAENYRALRELSTGGLELKIGLFFTEIMPLL